MPVTVKCILMRLALKGVIKRWVVQKGAQHQGTLGRGCAWYAAQSHYYRRYHSWLHSGWGVSGRYGWDYLLADKAYDTDAILDVCAQQGTEAVIPAKRNRKCARKHDEYLYRHRHLVENAFLWLKRWRGIATRYAKNTASFLAAVQIRCLAIWIQILWRQSSSMSM